MRKCLSLVAAFLFACAFATGGAWADNNDDKKNGNSNTQKTSENDVKNFSRENSGNVSKQFAVDGRSGAKTAPGQPLGVSAAAGVQSAVVSFAPPAVTGSDQNLSYRVTASPGGQQETGTSSPITVTGLTAGKSYTFKVVAINGAGQGPDSNPSNAVAPVAQVRAPGMPTGVTATAGAGQAGVSFIASADNGGAAITQYTVTASPGGQSQSGGTSPITVSGLKTGTSYTFVVTATNSAGTSASSAVSNAVSPAAPPTVPGAPGAVVAVAGGGQATVSFSPPSNTGGAAIGHYTVTASPGGKTESGASSPITVTGLVAGASYSFTVVAFNSAGAGSSSAPGNTVRPSAPAVAPGAPTGVSAVAGTGQATVSFVPPSDNGGAALSGYTVTASPGGQSAAGSASPITVSGLVAGTEYRFTVIASNGAGPGTSSSTSNPVTVAAPPTAPSAPSKVSAKVGVDQATVSFAPPASDGGAPITSYTVKVSPGGQTATGGSSPIVVNGLARGISYAFTVTATNSVGTSASSAPSSVVVPANVPGTATNVLAVAGNGQVTVSFAAPTNDGGAPIKSYSVTSSSGGRTATGTSSSVVVKGLSNGIGYTFTVAATNEAGTGASSSPSNVATPASAPGAPTGVTAVAANGQATVDFAAPASNGGGAITKYTLTASPGGQTAAGNSSPITIFGLTGGTTYTFTVTASNSVDTGPSSVASNPVKPGLAAPGAPTNVSAVGGSGQAFVSFTAPAANGSPILYYTATASPGGQTASLSSSPIAVNGLANGTTHTFTVTATNSSGAGPRSAPSNVVAPGAGPPAAPTGVKAMAGNGQATVSFTPSSNNGSPITGFKITASPGGRTATGTASPITVTGLANGVAYTFEVTATNAIGTGSGAVSKPVLSAGMAASGETTFAVDANGNLIGWGSDSSGKLGLGRPLQSATPVRAAAPDNFVTLAAGSLHTVAIQFDGSAWAWGDNTFGQLGDGTTTSRSLPKRIGVGFGGASLAVGEASTLAIKVDGGLWAWGANVADGTSLPSLVPIRIGTDFVKVAAGRRHSAAIKGDGTLWTWGNNADGQLGDGSKSDRWVMRQVGSGFKEVAAGFVHTVALKSDGSLWVWGGNGYGQLGDGSTAESLYPRSIGTGYTAITAGAYHTLATRADGSLWAWGNNADGQLGDGTKTDQLSPRLIGSGFVRLAAGVRHTAALKRDGSVWEWGNNDSGQLGDGTTAESLMPKQVGSGYLAISAGYWRTAGISSDGRLWGWGSNSSGELGDGIIIIKSAPKPIGTGYQAISAAFWNTVAVRSDGSLWAWGDNSYGQLGDGSTRDSSVPRQVGAGYAAVASGYFHVIALKRDGSLWGWGNNEFGQVGDGTKTDSRVPKQIGTGFLTIAAGTNHSAALKPDGTLWTWGGNTYGQLGDGTTTQNSVPKQMGAGYTAVAAGAYHTVALKSDGSLWAWGGNWFGQLGDGTQTTSIVPKQVGAGYAVVVAGFSHTGALKADGSLWAWGDNTYGQLGDGTTAKSLSPKLIGSGYQALVAGYWHNLAIMNDGSLWAWGRNGAGQLGNGTIAISPLPVRVVNSTATGYLSFAGDSIDPSAEPMNLLQVTGKTDRELSSTFTDIRLNGLSASVYFTGLLPANSPLLTQANGFTADTGMVPVSFGRGGIKQTGPSIAAEPAATEMLNGSNIFSAYSGVSADPLANSNAVICMGVTSGSISAKGQALMRVIATGDQVQGVVQCPSLQTPSTLQLYTADASGPLGNRTVIAKMRAQPEDYGQNRNIYSWAVAPSGMQLMQTGVNRWDVMREPMVPALVDVFVPADGSPITLSLVLNADLTSLVGTLVYVGIGRSWQEVRQLNQAGHYYTVQ